LLPEIRQKRRVARRPRIKSSGSEAFWAKMSGARTTAFFVHCTGLSDRHMSRRVSKGKSFNRAVI
jgi:hypothetical protein